jgi:hypothetical protein
MPPVNLPPANNVCPFVAPNPEEISMSTGFPKDAISVSKQIGTKHLKITAPFVNEPERKKTIEFFPGKEITNPTTIMISEFNKKIPIKTEKGDIIGLGVSHFPLYPSSSQYSTSDQQREFIYLRRGDQLMVWIQKELKNHTSYGTKQELQAFIRDQLHQNGGVPRSVQPGKDGNVIKLSIGTQPADNKVWNGLLQQLNLCK